MSYLDALVHPFAPNAKGARIPDEHSYPTSTYSITGAFTVFSNSPQGDIDFMINPCPFNCITTSSQSKGAITGPISNSFGATQNEAAIPFISAKTQPATGTPVVPNDTLGQWGGVCTTEAVSNNLQDYRIVGYGARIRSLLPPNNQSGQVFMASQPSPAVQPPCISSSYEEWMDFCQYPGLQDTPASATFPQQKWISTSILNYPASDQNMYAEMTAERGMEWVGRITGPKAFEFKDPEFTDILTDQLVSLQQPARFGRGLLTTTGGTVPTEPLTVVVADLSSTFVNQQQWTNDSTIAIENGNARLLDAFAVGGWSSLAVRATGINLSSATGTGSAENGALIPVFAVEVIFHLEGTPVSGEKAALVGGSAIGFYDNSYFVKCQEKASKELFFRRVIDYDKGITSMFGGGKKKRPVTMSSRVAKALRPIKKKRVRASSKALSGTRPYGKVYKNKVINRNSRR